MNAVDKYHWKQYNRIAKRAGLKTLRFDEWDESLHERDENGKFTSTGGSNSAKPEKESKESTPETKNSSFEPFTHKDVKSFVNALSDAKSSLPVEQSPWRVTSYDSAEQFQEWHQNAKMHITAGGSTIAVSEDGDIVAVCHKNGDPVRGRELIELAVKNGGNKLDAYDGLFGFYTKCGFEAISWCKFNEEYAPADWKKGRDKPEDVIFYKYTGKPSKYKDADEFKAAVKASEDYDSAQAARNKDMEVRK